jgi:hypothetical protein
LAGRRAARKGGEGVLRVVGFIFKSNEDVLRLVLVQNSVNIVKAIKLCILNNELYICELYLEAFKKKILN